MSASTSDEDERGVDRRDAGDIERSVPDEAESPDIITLSLGSIEKTLAVYTAVTELLRELKARMQAEACADSK